ncbi:MAG: hypothetical protein KGZ39_07185 [Simkania sp.]|nr:hypothetical protein [Simkania sp.]
MMIFPILKQNILSKPAKNLLNFHHFFIEKIGLLQGRLLIKTDENSGCILGGVPSWEKYQLTDKGMQFVEDWKKARSLE